MENQITNEEIKAIRRFFVDKFIKSYSVIPEEILLDIDGFDAITYGHQQLSLFHGYYKNQIYFPVLINEAHSGYPVILQLRAGKFPMQEKGVCRITQMVILAFKKSLA